jgi:hypothetical protein
MHYDFFRACLKHGMHVPTHALLAHTMAKSLMVIPLSLHFLSNLLLSIIVPSQFGVHLRQGRVLN